MVIVGWLGEAQLAAHQIAINMASVTYMMATGISSAAAIRVSAAVGRASREGVWRAGVAAFVLSVGFMGLMALIFLTANNWLVTLYIRDNPEVIRIAASLVIMAGFFQLSDGVQVVALGGLRGLSDVKYPHADLPYFFILDCRPADELCAGLSIRFGCHWCLDWLAGGSYHRGCFC